MKPQDLYVIVGRDNPFQGDLTFDDFAAIFRGEITNWSEVGGPNLPIRFVDRPDESDTRLALADYEIFSQQPFETGDNAIQMEEDDTAAIVRELGRDGISYAISSEVLNQDAVRPVSMDTTLPDDPRYPYSQPRNYIYQGEPSQPVAAFLGFATSAEGQTAIEEAKQIASDNVTVGAVRLPGGVAVAPDSQFMVRGTEDGQLQWLDADGNPTETVIADAHRGAVSAVVVSPDGQTVVSSGADGTVRRWDRTGNPLGEPLGGEGGPILALALTPDSQTLASGNAEGLVERWSLADGTPVGTPITAHSGPVQALHYPAGGQALISGGSDGSLGFWNADGTAAGQSANAHPGGVTAITSSPDGQVLTTAGADGSLRNWDRSTLQPRGDTIAAHEEAVSAAAYSPDGNTLATAAVNGTLHCNVWLQQDNLNPERVAYNLALRRFRRAHPWLRQNLSPLDRFNRIHTDEQTVFYGLRTSPAEAGTEVQVAMVAHMGGDPLTVTPADWLQLDGDGWRVAVRSPGIDLNNADALSAFTLTDSQAVLLERVGRG
ncbi:glucosylglycerol hydrolase [Leptolyngbya sp. KIOST-1]|uniref:glucosylglycerol hydrolase n=1 Tax=Leptolyngbya sp. KIOST-1 TaxID=1229172 RepID=UPI00055BAC64|nr:glucosylglycerol hydrolase [Leptolyngbya sp. KIOST-1]